MTDYLCSACGAKVTSEGTEALDHMVAEHGFDPEAETPNHDMPYLVPVESNPTLDENGVPA